MNKYLYNAPNRLFLIINNDEYQIREPVGWSDATFSIKRNDHHGFDFKFPNSDLQLKFHNRKAVDDYQEAKTLIDAALNTYGADVTLKLRLEYYTGGAWVQMDEIELDTEAYVNGEYDSILKTSTSTYEKQIENILTTKVNLFSDEDYEGNAITQFVPEDVWYHSKVLRKQFSGRHTTLDPIDIPISPSNAWDLYIPMSFNLVILDEIEGYANPFFSSTYSNIINSDLFLFEIEESGEFTVDVSNLSYSFYNLNVGTTITYDIIGNFILEIININGNQTEFHSFASNTRNNVTSSNVSVSDSVSGSHVTNVSRGDKVYLYFKVSFATTTEIQFSSDFEPQLGNVDITFNSVIPGSTRKSYGLLQTLQKATEILTGAPSVESDFFTNTYPNLFLTSGSILKGGTLGKSTAPVITLQSALKSIDAIFNTGWNFENKRQSNIITGEFQLGGGLNVITGDMGGSAGFYDFFSTDRIIIANIQSYFTVGENISTPTAAGRVSVVFYLTLLYPVSKSGTFSVGQTITGAISGATAIIQVDGGETIFVSTSSISGYFIVGESISTPTGSATLNFLTQYLTLSQAQVGDTATGQTSGATGTVGAVTGDPNASQAIIIENTNGSFDDGELVSTTNGFFRIASLTALGTAIKIEESEHFYNRSNQIIDLTTRDIYDLKQTTAKEYIFNEAEFGYPDLRYDELNTVDEFNTRAEYLLSSRKIKNKYSKISDWKTQGYDIEFLRRQALKTDSTAFEEDREIYLVQCHPKRIDTQISINSSDNDIVMLTSVYNQIKNGNNSFSLEGTTSDDGVYTYNSNNVTVGVLAAETTIILNENISTTEIINATIIATYRNAESNQQFSTISGVISPETIYNAKLSPARNKMRHDVWLNASQHYKEYTDIVRNTNYEYNGDMVSRLRTSDQYYDPGRLFLTQSQNFNLQASNQFKHWVIPVKSEFSCELSFDEYMSIKDACQGGTNAYGYITHLNWKGETIDSWLLDLEGNPNDNNFKIITLWWRVNGQGPPPPPDFWTDENLDNILQTAGGNTISWT